MKNAQDLLKIALSKGDPTQVFNFIRELTEAYKVGKEAEVEIAKIEATKEVLIAQISEHYGTIRGVFELIFEERREVMSKQFEIIDEGISEGDKELIATGLNGLGSLIKTSPFADAQELSKLLEGKQKIEF